MIAPPRQHRLSAAVLAVALVVGFGYAATACAGDAPEPKTHPTRSASPTPSATAPTTPTAPVLPEKVKQRNKAGAEALVLHFLDALNYAGPSGDSAPLRRVYTEHCTRCEAISDAIDKVYANGGRIDGGLWVRPKLRYYGIENHLIAYVDATVDYTPQTWLSERGAQPTNYPAIGRRLHAFQLKWNAAEGWRLDSLDPNK